MTLLTRQHGLYPTHTYCIIHRLLNLEVRPPDIKANVNYLIIHNMDLSNKSSINLPPTCSIRAGFISGVVNPLPSISMWEFFSCKAEVEKLKNSTLSWSEEQQKTEDSLWSSTLVNVLNRRKNKLARTSINKRVSATYMSGLNWPLCSAYSHIIWINNKFLKE